MNNPEYIRLIHKHIDGELNADEQKGLQDILDRDPKVRRIHDLLVRSVRAIGDLPLHEPPAGILENIKRHIKPARYKVRQTTFLESLFTFLEPRRGWVVAFASVLLIGIVIVSVLGPGGPENVADLSGTIGAGVPAESDFVLQGEHFKGTFQLKVVDQEYHLKGAIEHIDDFDIRIQFNPAGSVRFLENRDMDRPSEIKMIENALVLHDRGRTKFDLIFSKTRVKATSVSIEITPVGESTLEKKILMN